MSLTRFVFLFCLLTFIVTLMVIRLFDRSRSRRALSINFGQVKGEVFLGVGNLIFVTIIAAWPGTGPWR